MNIDDPCAALRRKPLSLKEQALTLLDPGEPRLLNREQQDLIREALANDRPASQASIQGPPESLVNQWWAEWTKDPIKSQSLHHFIAKKTTEWHEKK